MVYNTIGVNKLIKLKAQIPVIAFSLLLTACFEPVAQTDPDFGPIKNSAEPTVHVKGYKQPRLLQSVSTLAWEDSLHISRDGLHLYAFYAPIDLFRYSKFLGKQKGCAPVEELEKFLRGPTLTMDLANNPWNCPMLIHSDIAHAQRTSVTAEFGAWEILPFSEPGVFESGIAILDNGNGSVDMVYSHSTEKNRDDIMWARGVSHNAIGAKFSPIPINTSRQEGNPSLERIGEKSLVLLYDDHWGGQKETSIWYTVSRDNGASWTKANTLGETINKGAEVMQGHLWSDGSDWWLYFTSDRNPPGLAIYRSKYRGKNLMTHFDNWGEPERIISLGSIGSGTGDFVGVGEPTLTTKGDIAFVVVYCAKKPSAHSYCDVDPWILEKKRHK